jgi:hypothetical protein
MGAHRKGQPDVHAAGIPFHRRIDEPAHAGEVHDFIKLTRDLGLGHPQDGAVEKDIFGAGQLRVKTGANL